MRLILGSASDRKIKIVEEVVGQLLTDKAVVIGCSVSSGVPDTPYDEETYQGARNRAHRAKEYKSTADYYVGLESGLIERYGQIYEEAWAAIIDSADREYYGYSSGLKVPDYILRRMAEAKLSHSDMMEIIEAEFDLANDTWGNYSAGALPRTVSLAEALRNAFIQVATAERGFYGR